MKTRRLVLNIKEKELNLFIAKKFYEKNNIIPLAEPDLEISSFSNTMGII